MDTIIRETLRPFGITRNYRGYPQTVRAIALVLEDESRLLNVTEEIYEVVALQTRCHPSNVAVSYTHLVFFSLIPASPGGAPESELFQLSPIG